MDAPAALKTIETGRLAFQEASSIYLDGKNVLSIVVEIDCAKLLGGVNLLAVVGETLARGKLAVRIERTGRPEVKNMLLAPKQFDRVNRDLEYATCTTPKTPSGWPTLTRGLTGPG